MPALLAASRIKQTSTTTGTDALTFSGTVSGYHPFSAIDNLPRTVPYLIEWGTGSFELGFGTLNADHTLSRERVLQTHSNYALSGIGNAVSLPAGTKTVSIVNLPYNAVQCWVDDWEFGNGYGSPLSPMASDSKAMAVGMKAWAGAESSIAMGYGAIVDYEGAVMIGEGEAVQPHCLSRMRAVNTVTSFSIDHLNNFTCSAAGSASMDTVLVGGGEVFTGTIYLSCKSTSGGKFAGWKIDVVANSTGIINSTITLLGSDLVSTPTLTLEMGGGEGEREGAYPLYVMINNTAGGVGLKIALRSHGVLLYT